MKTQKIKMKQHAIKLFVAISVFLIYLLPNHGIAQEVQWSEAYKSGKYISEALGSDENGIYVAKWPSSKAILEKYNIQNLNQEFSKLIDLPSYSEKGKVLVEKIFKIGDQFVVIIHLVINKKNKFIYAHQLDKAGNLKMEGVKVLEINEKLSANRILSNKLSERVSYEISSDKTHLLIHYHKEYDLEAKFRYAVLNNDFHTSSVQEIKYNNNEMSMELGGIDNKGNVYLIKKRFNGKYILDAYDLNGKRILNTSLIDKTDALPLSYKLAFDDENKVLIGGTYSNIPDSYDQEASKTSKTYQKQEFKYNQFKNKYLMYGTFLTQIDLGQNKIINCKLFPFNNEEVEKFNTGKKSENDELAIANSPSFVIKKLEINNGKILLIAEQYGFSTEFVDKIQPDGSREIQNHSVTFWIHGDLLIANYDLNDLSKKWIRRIPKYQMISSDSDRIVSIYLGSSKNGYVLIYNDAPENQKISEHAINREIYRGKFDSILRVDISYDGVITKKVLNNHKKVDRMQTKWVEQNNENIVLFNYKDSKIALGILDVNK